MTARPYPETDANLAATGKGFIYHGGDPDVERPDTYASYEWIGWVEPNNGIDLVDTWTRIPEP